MAIDQNKISRILGSTMEPAEPDIVSQVMRGKGAATHPLPLTAAAGPAGATVHDGSGDLVATCPTLAGAREYVAAVTERAALQGLARDAGRQMSQAAAWMDSHAEWLSDQYGHDGREEAKQLRLADRAAGLRRVAGRIADALTPAPPAACAWCRAAGDGACEHCPADGSGCIVCK